MNHLALVHEIQKPRPSAETGLSICTAHMRVSTMQCYTWVFVPFNWRTATTGQGRDHPRLTHGRVRSASCRMMSLCQVHHRDHPGALSLVPGDPSLYIISLTPLFLREKNRLPEFYRNKFQMKNHMHQTGYCTILL